MWTSRTPPGEFSMHHRDSTVNGGLLLIIPLDGAGYSPLCDLTSLYHLPFISFTMAPAAVR